jgi:cell division protein FtsL
MAVRRTSQSANARRKVNNQNNRDLYMDGSAIRKVQEVPQRREQPGRRPPVRKAEQEQTTARPAQTATRRRQSAASTMSVDVRRNRARAAGINKAFVVFLAAVTAVIVAVCVQFLRLKSDITTSMKQVASLESELSQLKEENDAYYSQVTSSVDVSEIRKIAIGRLGMKYPSEDQTETYQTTRSSYVRQYQDIPESK